MDLKKKRDVFTVDGHMRSTQAAPTVSSPFDYIRLLDLNPAPEVPFPSEFECPVLRVLVSVRERECVCVWRLFD